MSASVRLKIESASVEVEADEPSARLSAFERIGLVALRLAAARKLRNEAKALLSPPLINGLTDSKLNQARHDLAKGRQEWRAASSQLWRLAARMERGER